MAYINGNEILFSAEISETNGETTSVEVVQTTGNSETAVMSQKAVTDALANKASTGTLTGEGAPTTATEGAVGCLYMDTLTGEVYKCTAAADGAYTWASVLADLGIEEFINRKNLIDLSKITKGGWYYNGKVQTYPEFSYLEKYCYTDYIPVIGGQKYVFSGGVEPWFDYATYLHSASYFDENKNFVSSILPQFKGEYYVFDIPANVAYVIINAPNYDLFCTYNVQLEKGEIPTEYEKYISDGERSRYFLPDLIVKPKQIEVEYNLLHLPARYDLVVGDTFELFYKGVMLCKDPYAYNILVTCDIGNAYSRKFVATPTEIGTHTLTIRLTDDLGNMLCEQTTELVVSAKMASPASNINVLCLGDSLTEDGVWVDEVYRRLTKTSSATQHNALACVGDGLSNITFVGKKTTSNGAGYEGTGGWRYSHYNDANNADNPFVYNGKVDFTAYCSDLGINRIDQCYILLGWNMAGVTEGDWKAEAKAFIDLLIAHNSAIKIVLMGLQIPSYDGLGTNYGASGVYANYRALQEYVFNVDKWNKAIAKDYPNNVSSVSIAGQFDTENNMPTNTITPNIRNATEITQQSNGVHPAAVGYYQIADAVYRKFIADNA